MLRYTIDNRLGLVALYDIRPGNGMGQFLQPRSPHGVVDEYKKVSKHLFARAEEVANEDERERDSHPHAQQCNHRTERHLNSIATASTDFTIYHINSRNS